MSSNGSTTDAERLDRMATLLASHDWATARLDATPEIPAPMLLVVGQDEDGDTQVLCSLIWMPSDDTDLEHIDILQVFLQLGAVVDDAHRGSVALLLAELGATIPLGQLGLNDDEIILRHLLVVERGGIPSGAVLDELLEYLLTLRGMIADPIAEVAAGTTSPEAALASLP